MWLLNQPYECPVEEYLWNGEMFNIEISTAICHEKQRMETNYV